MVDWNGTEAYESDVRGYFLCCPLCGSNKLAVHIVPGGRDALSCCGCGAKWHLYIGLTGLKWAELDLEGEEGKGAELLGKRLNKSEWQKMAQNIRNNVKDQTRKETKGEIAIEKEVIREKEVVVKMRCSYCRHSYDETLDKCPHCGARN